MLRNHLGMRYKKVKKVTFQGNSEQNLVKRHLYCKVMLKLLDQGKRVLNIDETWINEVSTGSEAAFRMQRRQRSID